MQIHNQIQNSVDRIKAIQDEAVEHLMGREVRIVSQYNGQQYGTSKKPLTGKRGKIEMVAIDGDKCHVWITDLVYGYPGLELKEVEFI